MICEECGDVATWTGEESRTLVGYGNSPGHNHDDNCRVRPYRCPRGHIQRFSIIPKCECGWRGRESCFCSTRVEEYPS